MMLNNVYIKLLGTIVMSIGLMVILFLSSEEQVHRNNAFIRRFPPHPVIKEYDIDLGFNSYYVAGLGKDMVYLGNSTAPLHLLKINLATRDTAHVKLKLSNTDLPFKNVHVQVQPPFFFVLDGSIPYIFRGSTNNWVAGPWMRNEAYFTKSLVLDSNRIYIKTMQNDTRTVTLGLLEKRDHFSVELHPEILQRQIDGVFDVDGIMLTTPDKTRLGYVYFYRNQFMTIDSRLKTLKRQQTIDTVKKARIEIAQLDRSKTSKMKSPPLVVNTRATMYKNFMFIASDRLGKNENREILKVASIIDVYNWSDATYRYSFYLYHMGKEKVHGFSVNDGRLVALIDNALSVYNFREGFVDHTPYGEQENITGQ